MMALHDLQNPREQSCAARNGKNLLPILQIKYIQRDLVPLSYAQLYGRREGSWANKVYERSEKWMWSVWNWPKRAQTTLDPWKPNEMIEVKNISLCHTHNRAYTGKSKNSSV